MKQDRLERRARRILQVSNINSKIEYNSPLYLVVPERAPPNNIEPGADDVQGNDSSIVEGNDGDQPVALGGSVEGHPRTRSNVNKEKASANIGTESNHIDDNISDPANSGQASQSNHLAGSSHTGKIGEIVVKTPSAKAAGKKKAVQDQSTERAASPYNYRRDGPRVQPNQRAGMGQMVEYGTQLSRS